jgi:hypothetical protein
MFISDGNPLFYKVELYPTPNFKMLLESPIWSIELHGLPTIYICASSPIVMAWGGCVKRLSHQLRLARWPEYMFISDENHHLTSRFCRLSLVKLLILTLCVVYVRKRDMPIEDLDLSIVLFTWFFSIFNLSQF